MKETIILLLFALGLFCCVAAGISILWALAFGLMLFSLFALSKGFTIREVLSLLVGGIRKVWNILAVFFCIGLVTASWRISGTIACIVCYGVPMIVPRLYLLCVFFLCCGSSFITGTSFGTVSTVGSVCMILGRAAGIDALALGGAILAGSFFGDRCSPMSSSALLVAQITATSIYTNVKTMFRTAAIPLAVSCGLYLLLGGAGSTDPQETLRVFQDAFVIHPVLLLPAVVAVILCALRVEVKRTMLLSVATAILLSVLVQGQSFGEILRCLLLGFHPQNESLRVLLEGGGISSMANVTAIVCISSSFIGLLEKTGLLDSASYLVRRLASRVGVKVTFLLVAAFSCMLSCNQTLAILLTDQLAGKLCEEPNRRASWLEDTAVILAPMVPWSIASAVPLSVLNVPYSATVYAWFLYLIPLWFLMHGSGKKSYKEISA